MVTAIRKTRSESLAPPDTHDHVEIAAMLRAIGIALIELKQPTPMVTVAGVEASDVGCDRGAKMTR